MFAINIEKLKGVKYCIFLKKHKVFLLSTVSEVMNTKVYFKKRNKSKY